MDVFDTLWHGVLRRPYVLKRTIDRGGGTTVVLLHGIGRSGETWQNVADGLDGDTYRTVAFDLLGFGASPKPKNLQYNIDDHAEAVAASIRRLRPNGPVVIVGHSMGCLVAVRVARNHPKLVKHLVLYEMPLYDGLPDRRLYKLRLDLYYKLYDQIIRYKPSFSTETARLAEKIAWRIAGFELTPETWQPFVRSLQHTIICQTAARDIVEINIPMDVIYGSFDMLVIRGKPQQTFGSTTKVSAHTIRARHEISKRASRFIIERVNAVENPSLVAPDKRLLKDVLKRVRRAQYTTD